MPTDPLMMWRMKEWALDKAPRLLRESVRKLLMDLQRPAAERKYKEGRYDMRTL